MSHFYIDDHNYTKFIDHLHDGEIKGRGLLPRTIPYGQADYCAACTIPTLSDEQLLDAFSDQEKQQSSAWHVWKDSKIGTLDQDGLSYCHGFSACDAVMIERERQGLPHVELSASSIAAPVTGYRNAGAYILNDLKQTINVGVATTEFVPMRTTRAADFKPGWKENAALHKTIEWQDGKPRDVRSFFSVLATGRTVCIGLNYWSHAVTAVQGVIVPKEKGVIVVNGHGIATKILNSWRDTWGDKGCAVLAGSRGIPDEWYVLLQILASKN